MSTSTTEPAPAPAAVNVPHQQTAASEPPAAAGTGSAAPATKSKSIKPRLPPRCRFFAQGNCREGDTCKFRHELKPQPSAQPKDPKQPKDTAAASGESNPNPDANPDANPTAAAAAPSASAARTRNTRNRNHGSKKPASADAPPTDPATATAAAESEAPAADSNADPASATPRAAAKRNPRQRTRKPKSKPEPEPTPEPEPATPRQAHLSALRAAYPTTTLVTATSVTLAFPPSDPDFPYPLDHVHLALTLPLDYPASPPTVHLANDDIPADVRDVVAKSIAHRLASNQAALTLVQVVHWVDKNLEKLIKGELNAPKSTLVFVRPGASAAARAPVAKPASERNRESELKALERRFRGTWIQVSQTEMQLTLAPTDPEWPFPGLDVYLGVTLPMEYGAAGGNAEAQWRVLNTDVSPRLAGKVEEVLREAGKAGLGLLASVNRLDRALVGIVSGLAEEDEAAEEDQMRDVSSDSSSALTSDEDDDEHDDQHKSNAQLAVPKSGATQIKLPAVTLDGISVLECTSLSILLTCVRCKHASEFHVIAPLPAGAPLEWQLDSPNAAGMQPCTKCAAPMGIRWTAALMHLAHPVLGYASLLNASPMDLLPCTFSATCAACTSAGQVIKRVVVGGKVKTTCRACHAGLGVGYEVARFLRVGSGGLVTGGAPVGGAARRVKASDEGIVPGQPLPRMGRCTHYSKSFRWFRFPCCARAFACDVCHEKGKADEHEMVRANRMICGYCSKEQPFSAAGGCAFCHASLVAKSSSGFWEGGKGTRDVGKMSRGESKKYKGTAKTVSKKGERVGKEGAEKVKKEKEKGKRGE